MDDFDRENEADLIVAAEKISVATMALMIRECSGIVCLCLTEETADRLELPLMVPDNESRFQTAFTVTVDAREGVTTGVSAQDRVTTIRAAIADDAKASDLVSPRPHLSLSELLRAECWPGPDTPKDRWNWRGWPG